MDISGIRLHKQAKSRIRSKRKVEAVIYIFYTDTLHSFIFYFPQILEIFLLATKIKFFNKKLNKNLTGFITNLIISM